MSRRAVPLIAALLVMGGVAQLHAQDVPAVFVHGLRADGSTWQEAAARLAQRLALTPYVPTIPSSETYQTQAQHLQGQFGGLPANTVTVGHSNGGLVAREWSRIHPLSGIVTIGTPHSGAPIVSNLAAVMDFNYLGMNLVNATFGAFPGGGAWWDVLVYANDALNFAFNVGWTAAVELVATAGYQYGLTAPVVSQMHPGSSFLGDINSGVNIARESATVPGRVGIGVTADRYWLGGPVRAFRPELADAAGPLIYAMAGIIDAAATHILVNSSPSDVDAVRKASWLMNVAGWLWQVDWFWCRAVSSPYMDRCEANDGLVPVSAQFYPGAARLESSGPAHVRESRSSDDILAYALTAFAGVRNRGSGGSGPAPGPGGPDTLSPGQRLYANQYVDSADGRFRFVYQGDGNLVLYGPGGPIWATMTFGAGRAEMQADGNLVVYDHNDIPVWASGTSGHDGAFLRVQTDGAVVVYRQDGFPIWSTGTGGQ
jgi:pimeloyl-ACP methyl ester carboxylesterase